MYDGSALNTALLSMLIYGSMDPDNQFSRNYSDLYKIARPTLSKPVGKIIIFGTGGEIDSNNNFNKIWKQI